LTGSPFNDYSPIANCKKLETLEASYKSTFSDPSLLTGLANLKRLSLWENQKIQKWEPLAEMQSLESLSVGKTNFHDLKILKDLSNLRELSIQYCGVANPEAIATLPQLKYLYVNDSSGIEDISIFKNLSKIADLYVGHSTDQFPQEQLDILKQEKEEAAKLQKVFEEKFSDNRNNWYQGDDEQHTIRIEDKKYIFEHKQDTGYWAAWKKPEDFDPQKNFRIEVGANKVEGVDNDGYGIVLGAKDLNNHYQFLVNGNGSYSFGKVSDGKLSDIIEWTPSDFINKGNASNLLTVRKVGDQLKLYVNDRYVIETVFEDWLDTNVGFVVYGAMKVEFDHILVKN
jgi:hypothetical protein